MARHRVRGALVVVVLLLPTGCGGQEARVQRPAAELAPIAWPVVRGQSQAPDEDGPADRHLRVRGRRALRAAPRCVARRPQRALGPITRTLADADLTMVNLESAITERGTPEAKELEDAAERFHFRTSPAALDVLAAAGSTWSRWPTTTVPTTDRSGFATLSGDPQRSGPRGRHRPEPEGGPRSVPGLHPRHRHRVPRRRHLLPRGRQQRLGCRPENPRHRRRSFQQAARAPRRRP